MRFTLSALVLLSAFAIPAAVHATTITLTIDGGPSKTYTIPTTPSDHYNGVRVNYFFSPLDLDLPSGSMQFSNPTFFNSVGSGLADFTITYQDASFYQFFGVQLYSGSESNPVFTPGTYNLGPDTIFGSTDTATMVISNGVSPAATPEPSSLILLGSGIVSLFGVTRRRLNV